MAGLGTTVVRLSDLQDGQEAECFAALVKKVRGVTSRNDPFIKCYFRDKRVTLEAPLWSDHRLHGEADGWADGVAYRLRARAEFKLRYGLQLDLIDVRRASNADE